MDWINVKERLPEKVGKYLIAPPWKDYLSYNDISTLRYTANYSPETKQWWTETQTHPLTLTGGITHWMELPGQPK